MEVETKYIAPRSAPFVSLMQVPELGGFHLEPMQAVSVRDVYLDTLTGDLMRQGFVFRVREQDGDVMATLKSLARADGALHRRLELEAALGAPLADGRLPILPDGELRDLLDRLIGREALQETIRVRQYRTPRVVFDGARLVGVLSLDVVAQETARGLHVTNEVEVELAETGREEDLYRLDPVLRAQGLEPTTRSKFERGLMRVQQDAGVPLLLLPDERDALERYQESGTPLHRRRARVVLLAARGLRPATIANKAGLSPSRVQHWIEAFRDERMGIFTVETEPDEALTTRRPMPAYRVSELVTGGTPRPALFRRDHFAPDPAPEPPASTDDDLPSIVREEEVASSRTPVEPFVTRTFGDGAHLHPEPVEPASFEDVPLQDPLPQEDLSQEDSMQEASIREDEPASVAEDIPSVDEEDIEGVDSLADLLHLFETRAVGTPRLERPEEPGTQDVASETAIPSEDDGPGDTPLFQPPIPWESAPEASAVEDEPVEPVDERDAEIPEPEAVEANGLASFGGQDAPATDPADSIPTPSTDAPPAPPDPPAAPRASMGRRLTLAADDPVLPSCERVLQYHFDGFVAATERLLEAPTAPAVRRILIAAHRVRIALELFGDYLPPRTARRLHRGLRGTARALDALGDRDLVLAHVTDAQASASADERPDFDALLVALEAERQAAWQSVALRLRSSLHTQWLRRFERLLALLALQTQAGLTLGDHAREEPDDYLDESADRPQRDHLRYMLGSTLWNRYEAVRAYDTVVEGAGDELLHPLGVACSGLQFALGLASGCAERPVRPVAQPLAGVESHLALLHHVRLTADALTAYADAAPVRALQERLRVLHDEALREVPGRWADVVGADYREGFARFVASI